MSLGCVCVCWVCAACRSQRSTPIHNDALGCNAVSWAPYHPVHSHGENNALVYRLVTGACDNTVRVWRWLESEDSVPVQEATKTEPHTGTSPLLSFLRLYVGLTCDAAVLVLCRLGPRRGLGAQPVASL